MDFDAVLDSGGTMTLELPKIKARGFDPKSA